MSSTISVLRRTPAHSVAYVIVIAVAAWAAGCRDKNEMPASLKPAPGTVVKWANANNMRCSIRLEPYTAADGQRGGAQCVNEDVLKQICKQAHCEEVKYVNEATVAGKILRGQR